MNEPMSEARGLYLAGLALTSEKILNIDLTIRELWLIVSALQLTVTHPGLHEPLKSISEKIGRDLGARIVEALPEVEELLEMGWHREHDWIEQEDDDEWGDDFDEFLDEGGADFVDDEDEPLYPTEDDHDNG